MHFGHCWKVTGKYVGTCKLPGFEPRAEERAIIELQLCKCGEKRAVVSTTKGIVWKGDPLLLKGYEAMEEK